MPTEIIINNITGSTDFNIYICDDPITTCFWIAQITSLDLPYTFTLNPILDGQPSYNLKIVDGNGCEIIQTLTT